MLCYLYYLLFFGFSALFFIFSSLLCVPVGFAQRLWKWREGFGKREPASPQSFGVQLSPAKIQYLHRQPKQFINLIFCRLFRFFFLSFILRSEVVEEIVIGNEAICVGNKLITNCWERMDFSFFFFFFDCTCESRSLRKFLLARRVLAASEINCEISVESESCCASGSWEASGVWRWSILK